MRPAAYLTSVDLLTRSEAWTSIKGQKSEWYVYVLWRQDRTKAEPFYVGKGRNYRVMHHELPSKGSNNPHKQRIIDKQHRIGVPIAYSIDFYPSEMLAFEAEQRVIKFYGRRDNVSGILCNLTDGGEGEAGRLGLKGEDNPRARPVCVDGTTFLFLGAAAEHLGIDVSLISYRIKNGWPGYFYKDEGQRLAKSGILQRYRKAVSLFGVAYPSLASAAAASGIDLRLIAKRIAYGWDGYFYISEGQVPRRVRGRRSDNVAVVIDYVAYPSMAIAAKARFETVGVVRTRCASSNFPSYQFVDASRDQARAPIPEQVGIVVDRRLFSSISEAGREYGLTGGAVHFRCRSSNFPGWRYSDDGRQVAEGFNAAFSSRPKSVSIAGKSYASQSAAAAALGIDISTLKRRCTSLSFPMYISEDTVLAKRPPKDGKRGLIKIEVNGQFYRSVNSAAKVLNLPRPIVLARCGDPAWPTWQLSN